VNNLDLSVQANAVYGIVSAVIENLDGSRWFDFETQDLAYDAVDLMTWAIRNGNLLTRPDLALLYYPPIYSFYWFTSRTLRILNERQDKLPFSILEDIREKLDDALKNYATNQILNLAKKQADFTFFDDFLGNNDKDLIGKPKNNADDRIFSTSMAVNFLIDTWTAYGKWHHNTPKAVINTVKSCISFLVDDALAEKYHKNNAFFAGPIKGIVDLPYFYPANRLEFLNKTTLPIDDQNKGDINENLIPAVSGIYSKADYYRSLNQTHFSEKVPLDFKGYNVQGNFFPFWSSTTLTYTTTLLASIKFYCLKEP